MALMSVEQHQGQASRWRAGARGLVANRSLRHGHSACEWEEAFTLANHSEIGGKGIEA